MLHSPNMAQFGGRFDVRVSHTKVKQNAEKLSRALMQIKELENKEHELQMKLDSLQGRFDKLLKGSMQAMWEYCTQNSTDFGHIPPCDHHLIGKHAIHITQLHDTTNNI